MKKFSETQLSNLESIEISKAKCNLQCKFCKQDIFALSDVHNNFTKYIFLVYPDDSVKLTTPVSFHCAITEEDDSNEALQNF